MSHLNYTPGTPCSTLQILLCYTAPDISNRKLEVDAQTLNMILDTGEYMSMKLDGVVVPAINLDENIICQFYYDFTRRIWSIQ